jgi:thiamine-phosphate pyrophosphorylase
MHRYFTPAAERALAQAQAWINLDRPHELGTLELLLGLLEESESRGATILSAHGIDADAVRRRWQAVGPSGADSAARPWSAELGKALDAAAGELAEVTRGELVSTEHLLLGLAAADAETSQWLSEHGLTTDAIQREIGRQRGLPQHTAAPLDFDDAPPAPDRNWRAGAEPGLRRILDAVGNRAREGLRVVEDIARFVLEDARLTEQLKCLRHEATLTLKRAARADLRGFRDAEHDVGAGRRSGSETPRKSLGDVITANFRRVQESFRTLEEVCKLADLQAARVFENLRYRAYTLEKAMAPAAAVRARRAEPAHALYVLVDGAASTDAFDARLEVLISAGARMFQLRDKRLSDRELLQRAAVLASRMADVGGCAIVNDRPDLALLAGMDGVHVGQSEATVANVRRILGPGRLVGVSTHSSSQLNQAADEGADYAGVGPTFPSRTKEFDDFPGLELVRTAAATAAIPWYAIGGITPDNVCQVLDAGATRVAVSGAIANAADPAAVVDRFLRALDRATRLGGDQSTGATGSGNGD